MGHVRTLAIPFSVVLLCGCKSLDRPPPPPQIVVIRVLSDPGKPVKDAAILFEGRKIGVTGEDGSGEIKLVGRDGDTFEVTVSCPKGFESPHKPIPVPLKRLAESTKKPQYEVRCPPTIRTVVVAVRADGGPNLPVMLLGREIARTDTSGAAHVMMKLEPGEQFDLMLDTSGDATKTLRPQNPTRPFAVQQQDDIFTFDQTFDHDKPKFVRGPAKPKGPAIPVNVTRTK